MNRENTIVYIVLAPDVSNTLNELKTSFGVEKAVNINRDLYIKTYKKISSDLHHVVISYSKSPKYYDLRWLSENEPGFLDFPTTNYNAAFQKVSELAFRIGAKKVVWINHLCPFINIDDISFAFSNISDKNIVIGPAKNKGVYLLGFMINTFKIFENVYPVRENMFDEIIDKLKKNRFSYIELEEKFIVKDDESLKLWVESNEYFITEKNVTEQSMERGKKKHKDKENLGNHNPESQNIRK